MGLRHPLEILSCNRQLYVFCVGLFSRVLGRGNRMDEVLLCDLIGALMDTFLKETYKGPYSSEISTRDSI